LFSALVVIIIGHIIGNALMGLVALEGYQVGVPTMVLSRRPLGVKGSFLASLLNYLQLIGWTAVMNIVGARALDTVFIALGYPSNFSLWIIVFGLLNTFWTIVGPKRWRWLERISALMLLVLIVWLTTIVVGNIGFVNWHYSTGDLTELQALDLVVAMPVSWLPLVADYSRLVKGGAFWSTFLGYFITSSLFYFVGGVSNMYLGIGDPIGIIAVYGLGIPAMLIVLLSTTTTTFLDIYSAAITFKNVRPRESLRRQILFVGLLGTAIALIFPMQEYEWFLLLIGGAFVPLASIMIIDYFAVCRKKYEIEELIGEKAQQLRYPGIASWFIGFGFYVIISAYLPWLGATLPSMAVTGLIYYIFSKFTK
ncbi:MAG: putative hydroxymethylpyrimidine transporter CytX, partial [Candidatus Methanomethylicaceae archaeon]